MKNRARRKSIKLFGHFGGGNFGNECTLQVVLYHLRSLLPESELTCICTDPGATAAAHNIATEPISRPCSTVPVPRNRLGRLLRSLLVGIPCELWRWVDAFRALKGTDALIIPGTGLLTDAFGFRSWGPYNTFKWVLAAKLHGAKVLFISVGAGPIYNRLSKICVRAALSLADFRSYRDLRSMRYVNELGLAPAGDQICPDLVFSLPEIMIPPAPRERDRGMTVGLGLMEYPGRYSSADPTPATYQNYIAAMVTFSEWLLRRGCVIRLITGDMCDRWVVKHFNDLLERQFPGYDRSRVIDEPIGSAEDLLKELSQVDVVVATRFHNVLLALLSDKPTIAISFHHKCSSLMMAMGMSEYCLDIGGLRPEDLIERMNDIQANADSVKQGIRHQADTFRAQLDQQYEAMCKAV